MSAHSVISQQFAVAHLTGSSFPLQEQTCIQHQARIIADRLKQPNAEVWGKVFGVKADYILVRFHGKELIAAITPAPAAPPAAPPKHDGIAATSHVLYSIDGALSFATLDLATSNAVDSSYQTGAAITTSVIDALCAAIQGPFMGDPSYEYRLPHPTLTTTSGGIASPVMVTIKEAQRLSWLVRTWDACCRVVPRGSVLEDERSGVVYNRTFDGLDRAAAGHTGSYVHLRSPAVLAAAPNVDGVANVIGQNTTKADHNTGRRLNALLDKEGVHSKLDFLDTIALDEPKQLWQVKYDQPNDVIFGTNALFPGSLWFHTPETPVFGNLYMGNGVLNTNMAFML